MRAEMRGLAEHEYGPWLIPLFSVPWPVSYHLRTAASALSARVLGVHSACDNFGLIPRLVLTREENAALHPEGSLQVASVTVSAFLRFQIAEVLKDEN